MTGKKFLINTEGFFQLFIHQPIYREKTCSSNAYFKNIITGENCGCKVELAEFKYNNDGSLRDDYEIEEDVYELVVGK